MVPESWATILKSAIFIALIFGFSFWLGGWSTKEGFQTAAGSVIPVDISGVRIVNDISGVSLVEETQEEKEGFDTYEYFNFPNPPEEPEPTQMQPYEAGAALTAFDTGADIPWDYDNSASDPKDILWGFVTPACSSAIFEKCYMREIFGSANNFEIDPQQGLTALERKPYRANVYGITTTNEKTMKGLQVAEAFQDFINETVIETTLEYWITDPIEDYVKNGRKAAKAGIEAEKGALDKGVDKVAAKQIGRQARLAKWNELQTARIKDLLTKKYKWSGSALQIVDENLKNLVSKINKGIWTLARATASPIREALKSVATRIQARRAIRVGQVRKLAFSNLMNAGAQTAKQLLAKLSAKRAAFFAKHTSLMIAKQSVITAALVWAPPLMAVVSSFLSAFTFMCITFIPSILGTLADSEEGLCPPGYMNIPDALKAKMAESGLDGGIAWEFISAVPVFGDGLFAFAPYLCTNSKFESVLKRIVYYPHYYFDSTLSLFHMYKPKSKEKQKTLFEGDGFNLRFKDEYYDARKFTDQTGGYPVWVDFADKEMLDKMAQFYFDRSRKFLQTDIDGYNYYDYISKFYGIIASSELSCDVQVEITRVKFDQKRGRILEKKVLERPLDTGFRYHDRRFYFMIDETQRALDTVTGQLLNRATLVSKLKSGQATESDWETLARDNRAKFVVTGCTNVNLTAFDAMEYTKAGTPIGDAVISLGHPNEDWIPPILTNPKEYEYGPPKDDTCDMIRRRWNQYGMRRADMPQPAPAPTDGTGVELQGDTLHPKRWGPTPKYPVIAKYNLQRKSTYGQNTISTLINDLPAFIEKVKNVVDFFTRLGSIGSDASKLQDSVNTMTSQVKADETNLFVYSWNSDAHVGLSVVEGSILGVLPFRFGTRGIGVNLAYTAGGIQEIVGCAYQDVNDQFGTYNLNGYVISSQENFTWNRGPIIDFAPGYRPTIRFCEKQMLTQMDCASRFAIRSLAAHYTRLNPTKRIRKILAVEPRRKTTRNPTPKCVYTIVEADYSVEKKAILESTESAPRNIAVDMTLESTNQTCIYYPNQAVGIQTAIPDYEPVEFDFTRYDLSTEAKLQELVAEEEALKAGERAAGVADYRLPFRRKGCTVQSYASCADPNIQRKLIQEFNKMHQAQNVMDEQYPRIDSIGSIIRSYTPSISTGEDIVCVYYANFKVKEPTSGSRIMTNTTAAGTTFTPELPTVTERDEPRTIEFFLKPTKGSGNTTDDTCSYTLVNDTWPTKLYYGGLPKPQQWLDMPDMPPAKNENFRRAGCTDDAFLDCSGAKLVNELATVFNKKHKDKKILQVLRSYTPLVEGGGAVCDYEVDMLREIPESGGKTLANRETVRMVLQPVSGDACMYTLARDDSATRNSGLSLTTSQPYTGLMDPAALWPTSFLASARARLNAAIRTLFQVDVPGTLTTVSRDAKQTVQGVLNEMTGQQSMTCASLQCKDMAVLQAVARRYNFIAAEAAAKYPAGQYGVQRRTIHSFRRAAISAPDQCQFEVIEKIESVKDALKVPDDVDVKYVLRKFQFGLVSKTLQGGGCGFHVNFGETTFLANLMDISGNSYAIDPDSAKLGVEIKNGLTAAIDPMDDAIQTMVADKYNTRNIARPGDPAKFNTLRVIKRSYSPRPNIVEYACIIDHVYYDDDYGIYYTVCADESKLSYLVAKWDLVDPTLLTPNQGFNVETGAVTGPPASVEEFFPAELQFKNDTKTWVFSEGPKKGQTATPPYLFFEDTAFTNAFPKRSNVSTVPKVLKTDCVPVS